MRHEQNGVSVASATAPIVATHHLRSVAWDLGLYGCLLAVGEGGESRPSMRALELTMPTTINARPTVLTMIFAICLAILAPGCGGSEPTLSEYAEQLEVLVTTMNRKITVLDSNLESEPLTVEGTQNYFEEKIAARDELLEGFRAIEPPEQEVCTHST